jgi:hypothetical protein
MAKKETRISLHIRKEMKKVYGTILHKVHGGAYGETGASDLYGTLPGGRAIYVEVKTPETINKWDARRRFQQAWLLQEKMLGAFTATVCSWEDLQGYLNAEHITPGMKW